MHRFRPGRAALCVALVASFVLPAATLAEAPDVAGVNLAREAGITVTSSSVASGMDATRAVDGNTDGNAAAGGVFSSASARESWWQIDLGATYVIDRVVLHPRTDQAGGLGSFHVMVTTSSLDTKTRIQAIDLDRSRRVDHPALVTEPETVAVNYVGRRIRIQRYTTGSLQLAEVEVFARRIADAGDPALVLPAELSNRADALPWGVATDAATIKPSYYMREWSTPAPVLAIQAIGSRVYVGGRFSKVQRTATGEQLDRSYLAAFDRVSGEWIVDFVPAFNGPVYDLDVWNGKLVVAGEFSQVNGVDRKALVALNEDGTIATEFSPRATLNDPAAPSAPAMVHDVDVQAGWIYVAGRFGGIVGGPVNRSSSALENAGRFATADGTPDRVWAPVVSGTLWAIDANASGDRVVLAGRQTKVNGDTSQRAMSLLDTVTGAPVPGALPWVIDTPSEYHQWAVTSLDNRFILAGTQHRVRAVSASDRAAQRSHFAICLDGNWGNSVCGGDFQDVIVTPYEILAACHCNSRLYIDQPNNGLPSVGVTPSAQINGVVAFTRDTLDHKTYFTPSTFASDDFYWKLWYDDTSRCVFFGGKVLSIYTRATTSVKQTQRGFTKHCYSDDQAPTQPGSLTARAQVGSVLLKWLAATDNRGSVSYRVFRDDRLVATVGGLSYTDTSLVPNARYTVVAVDARGNHSPSAPIVVAGPSIEVVARFRSALKCPSAGPATSIAAIAASPPSINDGRLILALAVEAPLALVGGGDDHDDGERDRLHQPVEGGTEDRLVERAEVHEKQDDGEERHRDRTLLTTLEVLEATNECGRSCHVGRISAVLRQPLPSRLCLPAGPSCSGCSSWSAAAAHRRTVPRWHSPPSSRWRSPSPTTERSSSASGAVVCSRSRLQVNGPSWRGSTSRRTASVVCSASPCRATPRRSTSRSRHPARAGSRYSAARRTVRSRRSGRGRSAPTLATAGISCCDSPGSSSSASAGVTRTWR